MLQLVVHFVLAAMPDRVHCDRARVVPQWESIVVM